MRKTNFLTNRWVKFTLSGSTCIGISYLQRNADIDDTQSNLVHFISNERKTSIVNFHECVDLTYLKFVKKPVLVRELKINNVILKLEAQIDLLLCPSTSKSTIKALTENLIIGLAHNNN